MTIDVINDGMSIGVREFKLTQLCEEPTIAIIAKRGSGKSFVARNLAHFFRSYPGGVIISETEKQNGFFSKFFPDLFIYNKCSDNVFKKIMNRQEKIVEKTKEKYKEGKKIDPRLFVLMDDCLANAKAWKTNEDIGAFFSNGRHLFITLIIISQDPISAFTPTMRGNLDYVFLLKDDSYINQDKLYKNYAGIFPNVATFSQVYNELTQNYGCMVIINRSCSGGILDKIFRYQAKEPHFLSCCSKKFNKYHELNYDDEWKKKNRLNADDILRSKAKSRGKVKINVVPN